MTNEARAAAEAMREKAVTNVLARIDELDKRIGDEKLPESSWIKDIQRRDEAKYIIAACLSEHALPLPEATPDPRYEVLDSFRAKNTELIIKNGELAVWIIDARAELAKVTAELSRRDAEGEDAAPDPRDEALASPMTPRPSRRRNMIDNPTTYERKVSKHGKVRYVPTKREADKDAEIVYAMAKAILEDDPIVFGSLTHEEMLRTARAAIAAARPLIEREARSKALDEVMKALAASDAAYNIAAPIVHALKEKPHA